MGLLDFLFKRGTKVQAAVALDIGTEFCKALIFSVEEGIARVLGVGRERQRLSDMYGGAVTDIQGVIETAGRALEAAAAGAKFAPRDAIIGIAGELVKGAKVTVRYERDDARRTISYEELRKIVSEVQERAFEQARSQLALETGQSEIDVRLVNAALVDVTIDGHRVTNPLGFLGKVVEIGIFNAFAPIVQLSALQTIASSLGLSLLSIATEPYAVARSIGLEDRPDFSGIFLDVGGGTTDIAVVRKGGVEGTKMFALAGRSFTRRLQDAFRISFDRAEELKLRYARGEVAAARTERIANLLEKDAEVWASGVALALSEFPLELLPSKIFLCGGGSQLPEITKVLKSRTFGRDLSFARPPEVSFLKPSDLPAVLDTTKKLTGPADITPMALATLALDLLGEASVVEGVLDSVVETIGR